MIEVLEWFRRIFPCFSDDIGVIGQNIVLSLSNGTYDGLMINMGKDLPERPGCYCTTSKITRSGTGANSSLRRIISAGSRPACTESSSQ